MCFFQTHTLLYLPVTLLSMYVLIMNTRDKVMIELNTWNKYRVPRRGSNKLPMYTTETILIEATQTIEHAQHHPQFFVRDSNRIVIAQVNIRQ